MAQKPSIPKGTRDFSPQEVVKRNYIMDAIRGCFTNYGFQPIETPSFENSDTLMGKYGEEGDRLIFKILNSGDYLKKLREGIIKSNLLFDLFSRYLDEILINEKKVNLSVYLDTILYHYFNNEKEAKLVKVFILNEKENIENAQLHFNEIESWDRGEIKNSFFLRFLGYYNLNSQKTISLISEKALRYDLTVPFARYVVQHQNDITFPFKRYQMQPVWRADRPQKGRFREFYQCDADVVGSTSLWQEVELVQLYDAVFSQLKLEGVTIKMNNRKILSGIAEVIGEEDKLIDFTVALDKLDKIGEEGVKTEMRSKGISDAAIEKVQPLFESSGSASEKLEMLKGLLATSETGSKGIEELQFIIDTISALQLQTAQLEIDVTLARGLNYYTGAIFEVAAPKGVAMGSIGGGGRYDDLTGIFGLKDVSGVGISFGLDRIYLVLEELGLFPETVSANTKVLFMNFGEAEALYAMKAISALRNRGIASELYPDSAKFKKQMSYADKRNIPFVVLAGDSEMSAKTYTLKNMKSGEQVSVFMNDLFEALV